MKCFFFVGIQMIEFNANDNQILLHFDIDLNKIIKVKWMTKNI